MDQSSTLSLLFKNEEEIVAKLTIASESNQTIIQSVSDLLLPRYIDCKSIKNVPITTDKTQIDNQNPIVIYAGDDVNLPPILLLEETSYEIMLTGAVDSSFDYLHNRDGDVTIRQLYLHGNNENSLHILSFKGYVGKGFFDVNVNGCNISIPFEVRSKKIDYLSDYPIMLEDIAEFSAALLFGINSPLYQKFSIDSNRNNTLYEDFMVLDYIFNNRDLLGSYAQLCLHKHYKSEIKSELIPAGIACDIDPSDVNILVNSNNLYPMKNGPIAKSFAPIMVFERNNYDEYDTPENRVIKDLIITIQRMVYQLITSAGTECSSYIFNRLHHMCSEIDRIASDPWLKDVGELNIIPFGSTILQNRTGYSDLFYMYQIIGLGMIFKHNDLENLLKGQNCRIYQTYEYWCYTRLYRCLHSLSINKPNFPLINENKKWTLTIRRGNCITFEIPIYNEIVKVELYYNKPFNQTSNNFKSYSLTFRPDFTLLIHSNNNPSQTHIVNFDAKYKAKPKKLNEINTEDLDLNVDCWEFDIYKMHTYRDALIHSFGSYILYPGSKGILYPKPLNDDDWDKRDSLIIPSVGAIPLTPGSKNDNELKNAIKSIISEIIAYSSGCEIFEHYCNPHI